MIWYALLIIAALLSVLIIFNYEFLHLIVVVAKTNLKVPGPPADIVWGNISPLLDTPENMFKVLRQWGLKYYPLYVTWTFHLSSVNIVNPYDFEIVMSNVKHNTKGYLYQMLHRWLGTGLLTSEGDKWQERRKILTPSFHFNILQDFIKVFNEETANLVKEFKRECHKPYIAVTDYISDFTLNTIGETAMGTSFKGETGSGKDYKKAIHEIAKVYLYRLCRPWLIHTFTYALLKPLLFLKERKLVNVLHGFTNNVISNREKNFKPLTINANSTYSKRKRLAMLDLLLTAKTKEGVINEDGVREEVATFMFEGHDTTSVAISYALMVIACHKDVQNQIYEEIQNVVHDPSNLDYQTLQDLKYMDRCIKEILRLYPSVPFIARVLGEDITTHNGYKLKAKAMVHLHIYDVHHNAEIYPDPEKFDPDRFLPENCQNRHNFAYVPFSAGPRNCIGQKFAMLELKTVLCGILSEFVLEPIDTPDSIQIIADVVLRTKESIKVKFVPRTKN